MEKTKSGLVDLQALENAQNRQRNPWRSLEKKGRIWKGLAKCLEERRLRSPIVRESTTRRAAFIECLAQGLG